ncbi:hypothetical protein [Myxococcus landrumensis]|uniref:Outer membrane protein beta-barrel domain-containing protein n=1 Tax=Myxococcus landrumensis TaxID=2813577 RepID=A0ABX7NHR7_9BACT|nr:hypothetical protein [Myxococcus landrumus]QSQ17044.1 hypothetical protein JY572_13725 [Myxococcus landrumus]
MRRAWLLAALLLPVSAAAQSVLDGVERIDFNRPESWAMKYFTSVSLLTTPGTPSPSGLGSLKAGLEAEWIPSLSTPQRTVGFDGAKTEDLNKLPVIGRVRASTGLPLGLSLTLAYVPPIRLNGVTANIFSAALGYPYSPIDPLTLGLSVHGQLGSVKGDFVCPLSEVRAGNDPQRNPFNCLSKSHDKVRMNYLGAQLSGAYDIPQARGLKPYATLAFNAMDLEFHVNARYGDVIDFTRLKTDGVTFSGTLGLLFPLTPRLEVNAEVFYSPLRVKRPPSTSTTNDGLFNVRAMAAYRFF